MIRKSIRLAGERFIVYGHEGDGYFRRAAGHSVGLAALFELAKSVVTKETVVLDIGANIGLTAMPLASLAKVVHCFEPNPKAFEALCAGIEANGIRNCIAHNTAISDTVGEVNFHASADSSGSHVVHTSGLKVKSSTLDALMVNPEIASASFVKIDAEGSEPRILSGAREFMKSPRTVFMEFNAWCLLAHEHLNPLDVMRSLFTDYDVSAVLKRRWLRARLEPLNVDSVFTFVHDHITKRGCVDDLVLRSKF